MPTLTLRGQKPGPPPVDHLAEIGDAVIRLLEAAQQVGRLKERLDRMAAWLKANEGHVRWTQRDLAYWMLVVERSEAQMREKAAMERLARVIAAASQEALDDWTAMFGSRPRPGGVVKLARLAELEHDGGWLTLLDRWLMGPLPMKHGAAS